MTHEHHTSPFDEARAQLVTIRDVLRFAVTQFTANGLAFGHGFPDARAEAAYLIAWQLQLPHAAFNDFLDARLLDSERHATLDLIRQRIDRRVPAAYLTHEAWVAGLRLYVDERVLVPRSFIADLLEQGLEPWIDDPESIESALDLCTGSGCLAIVMAHALPNAQIDAVDISEAALEVARRNIADYGLEARVTLVRSDGLTRLGERRYDLIVCNPPYVDAASMAALPQEFRHEPQIGLAGGNDGLDFVRNLLANAAKHLTPAGNLIVEIGHNRQALEDAYPRLPFTWLETHAGSDHVFMLRAKDLSRD